MQNEPRAPIALYNAGMETKNNRDYIELLGKKWRLGPRCGYASLDSFRAWSRQSGTEARVMRIVIRERRQPRARYMELSS